ncbi:EVI5-like protein [Homalodisca vitripennis]|nr:EVI5-like protein [Homalodisca vitripennis]
MCSRGHTSEANGLRVVSGSPQGSDCTMSSVMVAHSDSEFNNNHALILNNNEASPEELALLAKLEEANRLIEADAKSLNSISNNSGHSRKSSDTSQISLTSGNFVV